MLKRDFRWFAGGSGQEWKSSSLFILRLPLAYVKSLQKYIIWQSISGKNIPQNQMFLNVTSWHSWQSVEQYYVINTVWWCAAFTQYWILCCASLNIGYSHTHSTTTTHLNSETNIFNNHIYRISEQRIYLILQNFTSCL